MLEACLSIIFSLVLLTFGADRFVDGAILVAGLIALRLAQACQNWQRPWRAP